MPSLTFAFRTLFKTPFVTVVAIASLALGLGANAAIYSLFDEVLVRRLPVDSPGRLVNLATPGAHASGSSCNQAGDCDEVFSYPMFRDLAAANTPLSGMAGHVLFDASVVLPGTIPTSGDGACVSGSYFPVLGLRPALGRLLTPADDHVIGGNNVVVVSYSYWSTALGASRSIIGSSLIVNGQSMTIVGVAPPDFTGTTLGASPVVFVPLTMRSAISGNARGFYERDAHWIYLFARLRPGATAEQARRSLNAVYHSIITQVEAPLQSGLSPAAMARFRAQQIVVNDGSRGQSVTINRSRAPLTLLLAVAVVLLSIACANIASLLMSRVASRATEMAVRLSLGATPAQLVGQVLAESVLLAVLGGGASVLVSLWTTSGIAALLPAQLSSIPFHLDLHAFALTAALALGTGLLFGIAPALESTRPDLMHRLRNNMATASAGQAAARFRRILVTTQIALSMALLISAGLFIKSLRNVSRVDLGIRPEHVVAFSISPMRAGYDVTRAWSLYDRVNKALAATPGVSGVTESVVRVVSGTSWGRDVSVEGLSKGPATDASARFNAVGPSYFHVLGVRLLAGRDFVPGDDERAMKVAVINKAFARKFNLGQNPIGRRISAGNDSTDVTIVGVANDWAYSAVKDTTPPVFVRPYRQAGGRAPTISFYVRTLLPPEQMLRAIPGVLMSLDPAIPIEDLETLSKEVDDSVYLDRAVSLLSAAFAGVATLLAVIGLYGVLAYTVAQRTREIGVRMALGASSSSVHRMVLKQVGRMTLTGGAIGIAVALAFGRFARSMLFEMQPYDPAVIVLAGVGLAVVAFGAGLVPAVRAGRIDAMTVLRHN